MKQFKIVIWWTKTEGKSSYCREIVEFEVGVDFYDCHSKLRGNKKKETNRRILLTRSLSLRDISEWMKFLCQIKKVRHSFECEVVWGWMSDKKKEKLKECEFYDVELFLLLLHIWMEKWQKVEKEVRYRTKKCWLCQKWHIKWLFSRGRIFTQHY